MHIGVALLSLVCISCVGPTMALAFSCPTALSSYAPAQAYCSPRFSPSAATVTATATLLPKTITVAATGPSSPPTKPPTTSTKPTTTPASSDNGLTKTITAIEETTVTNCNHLLTTCSLKLPSFGGSSDDGDFSKRNNDDLEAEMLNEIEKRQLSSTGTSQNQAIAWLQELIKGPENVKSVCSCIQTASRTITVSLSTISLANRIGLTPSCRRLLLGKHPLSRSLLRPVVDARKDSALTAMRPLLLSPHKFAHLHPSIGDTTYKRRYCYGGHHLCRGHGYRLV